VKGHNTMRVGNRLICSPYLAGSLGVMLCLVTFNYWSVSTHNSDLVRKVEELQHQLKGGSNHIQTLREEVLDVRKQLKSYKDKVKEERELNDSIKKEKDDIKLELIEANKSEGEKAKRKLSETIELHGKAMDKIKEELRVVKEELQSVRTNLTTCKAEVASERAEKLVVPPQGAVIPHRHHGKKDVLGPGQLPDINPRAVSVVKKETQGMVFHKDKAGNWLPILPAGNPDMPRAKPSVSVMDIKKTKIVNKLENKVESNAVTPSSNNEKPGSPSQGGVDAPEIVINEAGVLPLPNPIQSGEGRILLENVDDTEDDSHATQQGNQAREIHDDENPDGQIVDNIDLDKAQEEQGGAGGEDAEHTVKENGIEDNLNNLKKSLSDIEE